MKIIIETSTCKGELNIDPDGNIHDYLDAVTAALYAEGFQPDSIADGYANKAKHLREAVETTN